MKRLGAGIMQHFEFDSLKILQNTWETKPNKYLQLFKAATPFPQDHAIVFHSFLWSGEKCLWFKKLQAMLSCRHRSTFWGPYAKRCTILTFNNLWGIQTSSEFAFRIHFIYRVTIMLNVSSVKSRLLTNTHGACNSLFIFFKPHKFELFVAGSD